MAARDNLARNLEDDAAVDNAARCIDLHLSRPKKTRAVTIERVARSEAPVTPKTAMEQLEETRRAAETAWRLMADDTQAEPTPTWPEEDAVTFPPAPERTSILSQQILDAAQERRQLVVEARQGRNWKVHLCTDLERADEAVNLAHALSESGVADEVCLSLETIRDGGRTARLEMLRAAGRTEQGSVTLSEPTNTPEPAAPPAAEPINEWQPPAPAQRPVTQSTLPAPPEQQTTTLPPMDDVLSNWLDKVERPGGGHSVLDDDDDTDTLDSKTAVARFQSGLALHALKQAALVGVAAAIILGGMLWAINGAWVQSGFTTTAYPISGGLNPNGQ